MVVAGVRQGSSLPGIAEEFDWVRTCPNVCEAGKPSGWDDSGWLDERLGLPDCGGRKVSDENGLLDCTDVCPSIFFFQVSLLALISSTAKVIQGRMSLTASKSGQAKMFMKPICEFASLVTFPNSGGPPKSAVGMHRSFSISPWLANSS